MVRPVLYATFLIDRSLYGTDPAGYHLLNLLLHLGSGILVYRIVASAVAEERSSVPFWTALVFLIHPIATETVTYISGRASGLMAFFYLLAFFLYIKASETLGDRTLRRFYLSGAVACIPAVDRFQGNGGHASDHSPAMGRVDTRTEEAGPPRCHLLAPSAVLDRSAFSRPCGPGVILATAALARVQFSRSDPSGTIY